MKCIQTPYLDGFLLIKRTFQQFLRKDITLFRVERTNYAVQKIFFFRRKRVICPLWSAPYNGSKIHAGRAEAPDDSWVEGRGWT